MDITSRQGLLSCWTFLLTECNNYVWISPTVQSYELGFTKEGKMLQHNIMHLLNIFLYLADSFLSILEVSAQ